MRLAIRPAGRSRKAVAGFTQKSTVISGASNSAGSLDLQNPVPFKLRGATGVPLGDGRRTPPSNTSRSIWQLPESSTNRSLDSESKW